MAYIEITIYYQRIYLLSPGRRVHIVLYNSIYYSIYYSILMDAVRGSSMRVIGFVRASTTCQKYNKYNLLRIYL